MTAVLSTAGGVSFVGDMDRRFRAIDLKTGKTLWETRLGTSVQGFPLTFSVGGKQYVAVSTGLGGGSPRMVPTVLAPEVHYPSYGNALYVFALPDRKKPKEISKACRHCRLSVIRKAYNRGRESSNFPDRRSWCGHRPAGSRGHQPDQTHHFRDVGRIAASTTFSAGFECRRQEKGLSYLDSNG